MKLLFYLKGIIKSHKNADSLKIIKITGSVEEKNIKIYYKINGSTGGYYTSAPNELLKDMRISGFNKAQSEIIFQLAREQEQCPQYSLINTIFKKCQIYIIIYDALNKSKLLFTPDRLLERSDIYLSLSKKDIVRI